MADRTRNLVIEEVAGSIDIPDSAYDKAEARYKDLGEWFGRKEGRCSIFGPHIYLQGSFRLGTVVRPIVEDGEYDLDMGCRLRAGISKATHSQQQLKALVGAEIEDYRTARGIREKRQEKHRCWRLRYADALQFHLDVVPSIPDTSGSRQRIQEAILRAGASYEIAKPVADSTGAITDNRRWNYEFIDDDWLLSNSEGFALWFESRMKLAEAVMESLTLRAKAAKIERFPAYRWKTPLQRCVQLLKRHRDMFFAEDEDAKTPSVILTTLSARAYQGEADIADALERILSDMAGFANPTVPRIPNPVNPGEDFADRWRDPASRHLNLEAKFWRWLRQAQIDFDAIGRERKPEVITEMASHILGASVNAGSLTTKLGTSPTSRLLKPAAVPAGLSFPNRPIEPKKPEGFA
jgi:hypothetical protein